jgi:predicted alpha/beta-fold hydrolase
MPLIQKSNYIPPAILRNGHLQTIYASLFRKVKGVRYKRERIFTPDHDFIDLNWSVSGSNQLAIVLHGLEGSSMQGYVLGMVKALNKRHMDALAMNLRGCSGEPNNLKRSYHSGATEDLETVISHVLKNEAYEVIFLVGFSLGGNLILKFLGKKQSRIPNIIKKAVVISVPCDLASTSVKLMRLSNRIYMIRFMKMLKNKLRLKSRIRGFDFNSELNRLTLWSTFKDFDNLYTAPYHSFENAEDYWQKSSSLSYLDKIEISTFIINAKNDPFLTPQCFPYDLAEKSEYLHLETPVQGGHVGFPLFNKEKEYWDEKQVCNLLAH